MGPSAQTSSHFLVLPLAPRVEVSIYFASAPCEGLCLHGKRRPLVCCALVCDRIKDMMCADASASYMAHETCVVHHSEDTGTPLPVRLTASRLHRWRRHRLASASRSAFTPRVVTAMTVGPAPLHLASAANGRLQSPRTHPRPIHPVPGPHPEAMDGNVPPVTLHPSTMDENVPPPPRPSSAAGKPQAFSHIPVRAPWRTTTVASPLPQALPQAQALAQSHALSQAPGAGHSEQQVQYSLPPVVHHQMQGQMADQMQPQLLIHPQLQDRSSPRTPDSVAIQAVGSAGAARSGKGGKKAKELGVMSAGTLDGGPSFTCVHCAERFRSRGERKQHIRTVHTKPFGCVECKSCFSRKFDLEKHRLTVHRRERPYGCGLCELSFGQKHHLVRHQKAVHTKARDFGCPECGADFARKEHLANHVRSVHEKSKPFLCFLCDAEYCEKRGLRRHLESLHVVKQTRAAVFASWQPEAKETIPPIAEILKL